MHQKQDKIILTPIDSFFAFQVCTTNSFAQKTEKIKES